MRKEEKISFLVRMSKTDKATMDHATRIESVRKNRRISTNEFVRIAIEEKLARGRYEDNGF